MDQTLSNLCVYGLYELCNIDINELIKPER